MSEGTVQPSDFQGDARNFDQAGLFLLLMVLGLVLGSTIMMFVLFGFRPENNMEHQPYYRPYEPTQNFPDARSERPLEAGVVPRPASDSPGIPYVKVRTPGPAQFPVLAATTKIPFPITPEVLREGQQQYTIYCAACHGAVGDGRGMIPERGFYPPPSYHLPRLVQQNDAYFFNVMTNGYGAMFPYSDRVTPENRWKIVAYIRALQMGVARAGHLDRDMQKPAGVWP